MVKPKILFVTQEITPYMESTHMSEIGRHLPQGIQESKKEIRTFMPKFGVINERRNQLHEVIRLSGMNLIINDIDHPLIIKVASIQSARMQVYFIDNEDYFQRRSVFRSKSKGFFKDNDERAIFYARGVLETVKKLRWSPDIIHCHGWFSALTPMYIKQLFRENPLFSETKIVYSVYNDGFSEKLDKSFIDKLRFEGLSDEQIKVFEDRTYQSLIKSAVDNSDAVIFAEDGIDKDLDKYIKDNKDKILPFTGDEEYVKAYNELYDELLEE